MYFCWKCGVLIKCFLGFNDILFFEKVLNVNILVILFCIGDIFVRVVEMEK